MGNAHVWQGALALMILKTLESMGPLHGYGIACRQRPQGHDSPAGAPRSTPGTRRSQPEVRAFIDMKHSHTVSPLSVIARQCSEADRNSPTPAS